MVRKRQEDRRERERVYEVEKIDGESEEHEDLPEVLRSLVNRIVAAVSPDSPQFVVQAVRSMNEKGNGAVIVNRFVYIIGSVSRMPRERQSATSDGGSVRYLYTQVTTSVDGRPTIYDVFVYENRARRYERIREILERAYNAYRDGRASTSVVFIVGLLRTRSDRSDAVNVVNVYTMDEVAEMLDEYENPS